MPTDAIGVDTVDHNFQAFKFRIWCLIPDLLVFNCFIAPIPHLLRYRQCEALTCDTPILVHRRTASHASGNSASDFMSSRYTWGLRRLKRHWMGKISWSQAEIARSAQVLLVQLPFIATKVADTVIPPLIINCCTSNFSSMTEYEMASSAETLPSFLHSAMNLLKVKRVLNVAS